MTATAVDAGLRPLHRQPLFLRFWSAQTVSVFGDQVSALAIPLTAVLVLHASAFEVGLLTAMTWLPHLLFALPAGVWIDARPHRRRMMIAADLLRAATLATLPLAWWLGGLTVWQLLAVTFAVGALTVCFDLASVSFVMALVRRVQYVEAQGRMMTTRSLSYIAGPSIAGFLVQVFGAPAALLADAGSFVFSAWALRGTRVQEQPVEHTEEPTLERLRAGFRYLFGNALLRGSLLCTSTINFFNFFLLAIFVLFANRTLGYRLPERNRKVGEELRGRPPPRGGGGERAEPADRIRRAPRCGRPGVGARRRHSGPADLRRSRDRASCLRGRRAA